MEIGIIKTNFDNIYNKTINGVKIDNRPFNQMSVYQVSGTTSVTSSNWIIFNNIRNIQMEFGHTYLINYIPAFANPDIRLIFGCDNLKDTGTPGGVTERLFEIWGTNSYSEVFYYNDTENNGTIAPYFAVNGGQNIPAGTLYFSLSIYDITNYDLTNYNNGYNTGYNTGFSVGNDKGYKQGYNEGSQNIAESSAKTLMTTIFESAGDILSIEIFPHVSAGAIISVPLVLILLSLIIKIIRG